MPLLCGKRGKPLEDLPFVARAPIKNGIHIEIIRPVAGPNAGGREKFDAVDLEEKCIFSARNGQPAVFHQSSAGPAVEQQVGIAVAAVHVRRRAGNITRELRNGQTELRSAIKREYCARARSSKTLVLGKQ